MEAPQGEGRPPQSYLKVGVAVAFFNPILGLVAIYWALRSRFAAEEGEEELARARGRRSLCLSVVGVITTLLIIVMAVTIKAIQLQQAIREVCGEKSLQECRMQMQTDVNDLLDGLEQPNY